MNRSRVLALSIYVVCSLVLMTGCATMPPTVSNIIHQKPLPSGELRQWGGNLKSYLIGGKGIDSGMSVTCAQDGSCLLFGETIASFGNTTDYLAVKMTPDQKIVWAKTYDGSGPDRPLNVVAASDGGYLLVGISKSVLATPFKYTDKPYYPLIIKIDSSGNMQWARAVEYLSYKDFWVYTVIQSSDNGYIFSGYHEGKDSKDGLLLFKLSGQGDYLWGNYYRLSSGMEINQFRLTETSNHKLAIQFGANDKFGLFVTDPIGKPLWAKTYKGEDTLYIRIEGIANDGKGGFAMVAANLSGNKSKGKVAAAITRVTSLGDVVWSQQYSGGRLNVPTMIMKGYDNDLVITGVTGEGALAWRYGDNVSIEEPVNAFMLLIGENGQEKSSFISSKLPRDNINSVSKAHGRYFMLGDAALSKTEHNLLLSVWQPQEITTTQAKTGLFYEVPFKVRQEVVEIEAKPVKLATIELKKILSIRELLIDNAP